jgi:hypothetical protein
MRESPVNALGASATIEECSPMATNYRPTPELATLDADAKMNAPERLKAALRRLAAALDQLDAASERRVKADLLRSNLEEELTVLQDDRSRLAVELDGAVARSNALEVANEEVARRLKSASATIREVLAAAEVGQD